MSDLVQGSSFVAPHFISELGCEGLTLHEVAKSLGIEFKHAKEAFTKNINKYDGVKISASSGNPINPTVETYVLCTDDAKLFVASYNNDLGWAYRKFLIQCEKAIMKIPTMLEYAKALIVSEEKNATLQLESQEQKLANDHLQKVNSGLLSYSAKEHHRADKTQKVLNNKVAEIHAGGRMFPGMYLSEVDTTHSIDCYALTMLSAELCKKNGVKYTFHTYTNKQGVSKASPMFPVDILRLAFQKLIDAEDSELDVWSQLL